MRRIAACASVTARCSRAAAYTRRPPPADPCTGTPKPASDVQKRHRPHRGLHAEARQCPANTRFKTSSGWQSGCTTPDRMRNSSPQSGFSLVELLIVVAVGMIVLGIAVPAVVEATRQASLNTSVQSVAAAIRGARYMAVAKNRTLRVRFNCPAANQFRVIEVTGNAGIDQAANRCSATVYP